MKINYISLLVLLACSSNLFAQTNFNISGNILEANNNTMPFANVLLLKASDSTLIKGTLSNENGSFLIKEVPSGSYLLLSSLVGFQSAYSQPFVLNKDYTVEPLILIEGELLNEVIVEAKKPLFQQQIDRMVINVENSIVSAGGTALEVLERSPGVLINKQNNSISVQGKNGVVVMINGKISYMPAESLVQFLNGISADNIASIELITSPPSNLDAEGNAGYINIVLKKRSDLGLNGAYSISGGYGKGAVSNDNLNFNYRKNKVNIYGSYSFSLDKRAQVFSSSREYQESGNLITSGTISERDPTQRNHNLRLGLDFDISAKTITGFLFSAFDNKWTMNAINNNINTENGAPTSYVIVDNTELNHLKHFGFNYNFKHNFSENQFISFDIDYLKYKYNNPTDYINSFYDQNFEFISEELLRSRKETPLNTWVSKMDYSDKINENTKLEVGVKGTKSEFKNEVSVENFTDNIWVIDPSLTNVSDLNEKIFAAYGSIEYSINKKTSIKAGLRYEYTDSKLNTDTEGLVVDRSYGIWFPTVFLTRNMNDNLSMNLSYSKRITRPTFNDLAPFVILLDPDTFFSGNSSLQPAISNSIKYGINYKLYFLSFQYTSEDSSIAGFQERIDEETGRLIFEATNLDYTKTFGITLGIPIKITNWWRTQNNLTATKQKVRTFYNDEPIEVKLANFSANSTHAFKISDSFSFELSGNYNGPSLFGSARYDEVLLFNFGLQKEFNDKWGSLKFGISDIFNQLKYTGGTNLPEQNIKTRNLFRFSNRTFTLTYNRKFGNTKLKSTRNRETGSEEERQRVN